MLLSITHQGQMNAHEVEASELVGFATLQNKHLIGIAILFYIIYFNDTLDLLKAIFLIPPIYAVYNVVTNFFLMNTLTTWTAKLSKGAVYRYRYEYYKRNLTFYVSNVTTFSFIIPVATVLYLITDPVLLNAGAINALEISFICALFGDIFRRLAWSCYPQWCPI